MVELMAIQSSETSLVCVTCLITEIMLVGTWIEPWIGKPSRLFEIVLLHCLSATSYFFR